MWLLEAQTRELKHFADDHTYRPYAILSHTWDDDEVTFTDIQDMTVAKGKRGFKKILLTCRQALEDRIQYVWIDTCCIDKRSSAELTEAINSMFEYYKQARKCYVYLQDVPKDCPELKDGRSPSSWLERFKGGRWFERGWTLQELVAASEVVFYNANWKPIASLHDVVASVAIRTQIDTAVLLKFKKLSEVSIAQRMSWAVGRKTTRIEDRAYSLLGIFEIKMPLLYGERENAFKRLQEEILKKTTDHSILAWGYNKLWQLGIPSGLLADSPDQFQGSQDFVPGNLHTPREDAIELTNDGMHINLNIITLHGAYVGILNCTFQNDYQIYLAMYLDKSENTAQQDHVYQLADRFPTDDGSPSRLYVVDLSQNFPNIVRTNALLLDRGARIEFELVPSGQPLLVQIDAGCSLDIVGAFPADQWNFTSGTMFPGHTEGLGAGFSRVQNITAVVLRDRHNHSRGTILCFGLVGQTQSIEGVEHQETCITWYGFIQSVDGAEEACSELKLKLRARNEAFSQLSEGQKTWEHSGKVVKVEERESMGRCRIFKLSLEGKQELRPQKSLIPLMLQFKA